MPRATRESKRTFNCNMKEAIGNFAVPASGGSFSASKAPGSGGAYSAPKASNGNGFVSTFHGLHPASVSLAPQQQQQQQPQQQLAPASTAYMNHGGPTKSRSIPRASTMSNSSCLSALSVCSGQPLTYGSLQESAGFGAGFPIVLRLLHELLVDSELKLAMQLLDSLVGSGKSPSTSIELAQELRLFAETVGLNSGDHLSSMLHKVESSATEISTCAGSPILPGSPKGKVHSWQPKRSPSCVSTGQCIRKSPRSTIESNSGFLDMPHTLPLEAVLQRKARERTTSDEFDISVGASGCIPEDSEAESSRDDDPDETRYRDASCSPPNSPSPSASCALGVVSDEGDDCPAQHRPPKVSISSRLNIVLDDFDKEDSECKEGKLDTEKSDPTSEVAEEESETESQLGIGIVRAGDDLDDLSLEQTNWLATPSDRWILHPNHGIRMMWDCFALVFIVCECIILPMPLAFDITMPDNWHVVSGIFFSFDIALNLNTGYFHDSLLIMRRSWLTKKYVKSWLLLDAVTTIPWEWLVNIFNSDPSDTGGSGGVEATMLRIIKRAKIIRVLRLFRLTKVMALFQTLQTHNMLPASLYDMRLLTSAVKLFVMFAFTSHWAACVWGFLGEPANIGDGDDVSHRVDMCTMGGPCEPGIVGNPWKIRYGLDNYDAMTQYWAALQFTAGLITGGETFMNPGSMPERLFAVIVMIISVLITSLAVGDMLLIMNRHSEAKMAFDEQLQEAREFMGSRSVPVQMQVRVCRFLETQHKLNSHGGVKREFMDALSDWLRADLIETMNRAHLVRHPFFAAAQAAETEAIRRLCVEATAWVFAPEDIILVAGTKATSMHFVVRGKVRVDTNCNGRGGTYLIAPCWLGDKCLFVEASRSNTVYAVTSSETLVIEKRVFQAVLEDFPKVRTLADDFVDQILKSGGPRCAICNKLGHAAETCPMKEPDPSMSKGIYGMAKSATKELLF